MLLFIIFYFNSPLGDELSQNVLDRSSPNFYNRYVHGGGLCSLTVERSLAIQKVRISAGQLPGNNHGQVVHTYVPLSPSSIIW